MNQSSITVRYAKALYQAGEESGKLEVLLKDIELLKLVSDQSPEFALMLNSPVIKPSEKVRAFKLIFTDQLDPFTLNFFALLNKNKREAELPVICLNFKQMYKQKSLVQEAILTTSHPLAPEHLQEIQQLLAKKFNLQLDLKEQVNPEIIGGFKLRIEDQLLDASIASKLKKIRKELIKR